MPQPLTTTLLGAALIGVLIGCLASIVIAGVLAWFAVCIEVARFWLAGAEPVRTSGLVRSGESEPRPLAGEHTGYTGGAE